MSISRVMDLSCQKSMEKELLFCVGRPWTTRYPSTPFGGCFPQWYSERVDPGKFPEKSLPKKLAISITALVCQKSMKRLGFCIGVLCRAQKVQFHTNWSWTLLVTRTLYKIVFLQINYKAQRGKNDFQMRISRNLLKMYRHDVQRPRW